jgi:branched-subunit amino acid aminotransferase/4-amino-4-deoxychorismate lyase
MTQRAAGKSLKNGACVTQATDSIETRASAAAAPMRCELNGRAATTDELRALALTNYGHFTVLKVNDGGVRGLDLHLARLDVGTRELFGQPIDRDAVRAHLRRALAGWHGDAMVRITVFSRAFDREHPARAFAPDVLVTVTSPRHADAAPVRLKTFHHERALPAIKHVGTFALFHHRRLAQQAGFDDALFVDASGAISEASIWNIGFFDGASVVWPIAPQLHGVSMQLIDNGLRARGIASTSRRVTREDVPAFRSAFLTNCGCPVRGVASIDDAAFAVDADFERLLGACHASNPLQAI